MRISLGMFCLERLWKAVSVTILPEFVRCAFKVLIEPVAIILGITHPSEFGKAVKVVHAHEQLLIDFKYLNRLLPGVTSWIARDIKTNALPCIA